MQENNNINQNNIDKNIKNQKDIQDNIKNADKNLSNHPKVKIVLKPEILRELRKERNLTQKELGDRIEVSKQAVSNWENAGDFVYIRKKNLIKLARALACTPEYLQGKVNKKSSFYKKNELHHMLGMPLSSFSEVKECLKYYSNKRLDYLLEFLPLYAVLSYDQLNLLHHITLAIVSNDGFSITSNCPLRNYEFFKRIFFRTNYRVNELEETLTKDAKNYKRTIPNEIKKISSYFEKDMKKNFESLECPLRNKERFKESLNGIKNSLTNLINSLSMFYNSKSEYEILKLNQETFSELLNKAFNCDIDSFFKNIELRFR